MDVLAHDFSAELRGLKLVVIAHRGEHAGDGNRLDALRLHLFEECFRGLRVEWRKLLAVVFKAAADDRAADGDFLDILGPVDHRADAGRRGRADAQDADGREVFALDDGVRTLRRAKHRLMDLLRIHARDFQHRTHRAQNSVINVRRGRIFDVHDHCAILIHQDGVRIRAAHIDSKFVHAQCPPLQRSSSGI